MCPNNSTKKELRALKKKKLSLEKKGKGLSEEETRRMYNLELSLGKVKS